MYGFVEKELAEILVDVGAIDEYESFSTSNGETVAMLLREQFDLVVNALRLMCQDDKVMVIPSDVAGMMICLYPFWMHEELFDSLTTGQVKESDLYMEIRQQPSSTRFGWIEFMRDFKDQVSDVIHGGYASDTHAVLEQDVVTTIGADQTDVALPDPVEVEPPVESPDVIAIRSAAYRIGMDIREYIMDDDTVRCFTWNSTLLNSEVKRLMEKTRKHVFVIDDSTMQRRIKMKLDEFDNDVVDKIILIYTFPAHSKLYKPATSMKHTLLGFESPTIYQLHGNSDLNLYNDPNNPHHLGAAFSEFDYAYRDYKTGIIWALQKGNEVFLMFRISEVGVELFKALAKEMVDRFNGSLPYEEMVRRDLEYFMATAKNDENDFINLAVANSGNLIAELKSQYLVAKERYIKAMDEAMENAKIAQRLEENIINIDEKRLEEEEREKCKRMFSEVAAIPKVSAVKVVENSVSVYTKNIYSFNEKDKTWHDIGTFHIKIGMYATKYDPQTTVRIFNTKHQIHAFHEQMQAPHVFEDGHICHGNIVTPMVDAYKRRDLYQIVLMMIMFLENANLDDVAGEYLKRWPIVTEEVATRPDDDVVKPAEIFEEQTEEEKSFDDNLDIPIHV